MCAADVIGKIVDSLKKSAIRNFLNPGNKYCKHKGEDSLQGALREAKEEVGVDLLPEKGQVLMSDIKKIEFGKVVNKMEDVWLFEYDGEVDLGNATTDEVAKGGMRHAAISFTI